MSPTPENPDEFLPQFGLREFRSAQREVIAAVLEGRDCLCIMPTGGGKSLCYQLPALMLDGLTLVVSPLIALMKDQVDRLVEKGISATYINSTLTAAEQSERLDAMRQGNFRLVYVAPERFRSRAFVELVRHVGVSLLAVDEAHCISEWGHDFRHDYSRLGQYRQRIGAPPTIALTATATQDVQHDVTRQLALEDPAIFVAGFARDNLRYQVHHHNAASEKDETLDRLVRQLPGAGIIYASTRKGCELIAERVTVATGHPCGVYHAGLGPDERKQVQEAFMGGEVRVVAATNAFGMGIDKSDVRFVIHYNMPGTLEAYYQEAGRAGRDGEMSDCILLYSGNDRRIQEYFIESAYPDTSTIRKVYEFLTGQLADPIEITQQDLKDALELSISTEGVGTCERLLEKAGAISRLEPHRNLAIVQFNSDAPTLLDFLPSNAKNLRAMARAVEKTVGDLRHEPVYVMPQRLAEQSGLSSAAARKALGELCQLESFEYVPPFRGRAIHIQQPARPFAELEIDFTALNERREADYLKLQKMVDYSHCGQCRQLEILDYFGDTNGTACGNCDKCRGAPSDQELVPLEDDPTTRMVVRMALSGVARAKERYGKSTIAEMLFGSRSAKVRKLRLDQLSTFGRLDRLSKVDVARLLDGLLQAGWVEQFEREPRRPLMRLTDSGVRIMLEEDHAEARLPLQKHLLRKIRTNYATVAPPVDRPNCPAPSDEQAPPTPPDPPTQETPPAPQRQSDLPEESEAGIAASPQETATYDWTWHLFSNHGYSVRELAAIRNVSEDVICEQLIETHRRGGVVSLAQALPSEELSALQHCFDEGVRDATTLQEMLDPSVDKGKILLFLASQND